MDWRRVVAIAGAVLVVLAAGLVLVNDLDHDQLTGAEEYRVGTDPFATDSDDDGLTDGLEVEFGSSPRLADTDGDGLDDHREYLGTKGEIAASAGIHWSKSDPRSSDSDGDGIEDATETRLGLDPTSQDSDGDGLSDPAERSGSTDPAIADTDGDTLLDGWEAVDRTDRGALLPGADPLHKDMFVQVTYLRGVEHRVDERVFRQVRAWFAGMPVENPDGEMGIRVHLFAADEYSGPINRSIDRWRKPNGELTPGVSGYMAMREFYNRETMGPRVGSYFLLVFPNEHVQLVGHGSAGGTKVAIIHPWPGENGFVHAWALTITHELLHNIVREVGKPQCHGKFHTCRGFLSYSNETYLSEPATTILNERGFAAPVYEAQMNATSCETTLRDPSECGV